MVITDVYKKYKIMPALQLHQLRVAAVAKQICDNFDSEVDELRITKACLLHDMGNILKFDLGAFPQHVQPEGREYWEAVKEELRQKYQSTDEHHVSLLIVKELGMDDKTLELINHIGFREITRNYQDGSMENKICNYADLRVGPNGVISVTERLEDGKKRYSKRSDFNEPNQERIDHMYAMEKQIFGHLNFAPEDITDKSTAPLIEQLKTYET
jgi:hypothetical protein